MSNLYRTSNEAKTLEIEDTEREGHPFRMVVTLKKLNMVTMLDYFLTEEESQGHTHQRKKSGRLGEEI